MRSFGLFGSVLVGGVGVALGLAACDGAIGDTDVPGPPDVEPRAIPANPEIVPSTTTCVDRNAGESLLSVSPEGHAWFVTPGSPTKVRVLDAFDGAIAETDEDVEIDDVVDGQAWSAADAALISKDGLWRLESFARIDMSTPDGFTTPASLCGDPSKNGVLVSGGQVFERRSDGWWSWDPKAPGGAAPSRVVRVDGECRTADDVMWLSSADGTLYRVEPSTFTAPIQFAGLSDLAVTAGYLAVVDAEQFWVGTSDGKWQPWTFSADVPKALSASNGVTWMRSGDQLLRFDGSEWTAVAPEMDEPIDTIAAHADGAWLVGDSKICHASLGPALRVEGVRPYLRSTELEYDFRVEASDGSVEISADLDGEPIELTADAESGWLVGHVRLETIGWHTLHVSGDDPNSARDIPLKRAPETERGWATDIAPIYAANCSASTCHHPGSTSPPDLSTFDAWKKHSDVIRARVVEARTMPPVGKVEPDFGDDDISIIDEWIEGGMLP